MGILSDISNKFTKLGKGSAPIGALVAPSYQAMLSALSVVREPGGRDNIVARGFVRNLRWEAGLVSLELHLSDASAEAAAALSQACQDALSRAFPQQIHEVRVQLAASPVQPGTSSPTAPASARPRSPQASPPQQHNPLNQIKQIIAVASGKGGVGKSTTAVNLAYSLAATGAAVGLLDADVYGPSLPLMTGVGAPEAMQDKQVIPPSVGGVKIISVGMFTSPEKAQILRGPMAGNLVKQLLTQVAWGPLDYLIIDYPPGTGDIQLTISQVASVSGAILVTTPQEVALADVRKALTMFNTMKVPIIGVIETMSYFVCDGCDKKHFIFREGGGKKLSTSQGIPLLAEIPLDPRVTAASDQGKPIVLEQDASFAARAYREAATQIIRELSILGASSRGGALSSFALTWRD